RRVVDGSRCAGRLGELLDMHAEAFREVQALDPAGRPAATTFGDRLGSLAELVPGRRSGLRVEPGLLHELPVEPVERGVLPEAEEREAVDLSIEDGDPLEQAALGERLLDLLAVGQRLEPALAHQLLDGYTEPGEAVHIRHLLALVGELQGLSLFLRVVDRVFHGDVRVLFLVPVPDGSMERFEREELVPPGNGHRVLTGCAGVWREAYQGEPRRCSSGTLDEVPS